MWKPSLKCRIWKLVNVLLTTLYPAPCRQLLFGSRQEASRQTLGGSTLLVHPFFSGHLQTTRLHLSFCIADVFLKQLDVSELDRSALLRI